jgi:hypothetical protein
MNQRTCLETVVAEADAELVSSAGRIGKGLLKTMTEKLLFPQIKHGITYCDSTADMQSK